MESKLVEGMEQNSQGHWTCVLTVGIEHFHLLSFMDRDFFCQLSTSPQQASWRNQGLLPKTLLAASCIQILQDDAWLAFYILFLGHCIFWSCPVETEKPSCRSPLGRWWMAPCPPWRVRSPQRGWSIMPRCGRNWRSYLGRNPRNTLFFTLEFGWHMNIYIYMDVVIPWCAPNMFMDTSFNMSVIFLSHVSPQFCTETYWWPISKCQMLKDHPKIGTKVTDVLLQDFDGFRPWFQCFC